VVEQAIRGDRLRAGALLAGVIRAWEDPDSGPRLRALAEAAVQDASQRAALREYFDVEMVPAIVRGLSGRNRERRARAVVYTIAGVAMGHYVLGFNQTATGSEIYADLLGPLASIIEADAASAERR
jgi:hypothetical protein